MFIRITILLSLTISCVNSPRLEGEETFVIEAKQVTSQDPLLLQHFQQRWEEWVEALPNENKQQWPIEGKVNNFVVFSEDGLIMKDSNYHSIASCKEQILADAPLAARQKWMYVSLVSHVNRKELLAILSFLEEQQITYRFAREGDLVPE